MYDENENENNANKEKNSGIKIILVGDSGTGKTNLITVAAGFEFNTNSLTTTSCSYIQKIIKKGDKEYKVNLWDTIGQEKYRSLTKIFLKDSKIVIFVYDITNRATFESLKFWKKTIDDVLGNGPVFGVVGNKIDLYYEEKVKEEEGEEYANSIGAKFLITSAKNDNKSFSIFIEQILEDYLGRGLDESERIESIVINREPKKKLGGCC